LVRFTPQRQNLRKEWSRRVCKPGPYRKSSVRRPCQASLLAVRNHCHQVIRQRVRRNLSPAWRFASRQTSEAPGQSLDGKLRGIKGAARNAFADRGGLETGGQLKRGDNALNHIDLADRVAVVTGGAQGTGFAAPSASTPLAPKSHFGISTRSSWRRRARPWARTCTAQRST
jgi:hypothetical protein